ncbi:PAS domain S-box protein [Photobacterium gaetbulicola]|uniref:Putative methyl-accepting chemotaxis protein n=1 Tax=Photobacterium gaetbulicola Gung47 TaxID=658445 RepID=A0A0C5WFX3_9GAMM|nr:MULTISPECIES: PAS domain-containing methyl-accepting chemotaxis protein [Photobacterium]AJR06043.1 putative methyl-accepting chemotaxis protein [Photobacterium gaetbulicola Gung47]PSU13156.1 PAS domain S-box protein [Photobacterium gaetbulicola]WEM45555.1 PAS domain-containing methyl-accepting chemotaxis protein [Photobacterium sp. DA100]
MKAENTHFQNISQPGQEVEYSSSWNLISTTDPTSTITYANTSFCDVAGYSNQELVDNPHNIVRHADMPKAAFAQLWQYVKAGKSWMGLVKNKCKNGNYYWVSAFVTPIVNSEGQVIEYQSVRSRPSKEEIKRAEGTYKAINEGKRGSSGFRLRYGALLNVLLVITGLLSTFQAVTSYSVISILTSAALLLGLMVNLYAQQRLSAVTALAREAYDNSLMEPIYTGKYDDYSGIELALRMRRAEVRAIVGRASETSADILLSAEDEFAHTQQIKTNLQEQTLATEQVGVAIDQMASTVREVAENASNASEMTVKAQQVANSGLVRVEETITSVNALHNELDDSKRVINALSESSRQIEGILDVIGTIADQTNLLALNAAIEAARAGEAGRGFAVVADEVRSLAQKTQSSTGEIHQMITQLQDIAGQAVAAVERGGEQSEHCRQQALAMGEQLKEINHVLDVVTDSSHQIAAAVEQQAGVSADISEHIQKINLLGNETEKTSDISVESTRMLVERLEGLERLMNQFQRRH